MIDCFNRDGGLKIFSVAIIAALSFPLTVLAADIRVPGKAFQGDLVVGRVSPVEPILVNGKPVMVSKDGFFVIGVSRRQKNNLQVTAGKGAKKATRIIQILAYPWKIQHINGLANRYVNPPAEALQRIKKDAQTVSKVRRKKGIREPLFMQGGFIKPVDGQVTGVFGSQRILNGQPRSPHRGVDIGAAKGTPVHCPAKGIVALTAPDMYLMGKTIMVDHGLDVRSIFIHLDKIRVNDGQHVKQGEVIGLVGTSGRATGPHLHWGVSVGQTAIDPYRIIRNHDYRK